MALRKCLKEHKLFVAELERCRRLEREGEQVLSSLSNVAQRLPLLTAATTASTSAHDNPYTSISDNNVMGVLAFCVDTQALLLQKHFAALEKSMTFLRDIVKELPDVLRRMRGFVGAYHELLDCLAPDDVGDGASALFAQLEWMENVLSMYEHEVRRKRLLAADVEYCDAARITRMHTQWSARSVYSSVDHNYVQAALEPLPTVPLLRSSNETSTTINNNNNADPTTKKKKKKRR